jgi:hypothetical protein
MLKAPFQLLARGVRAVETMTALVILNTSDQLKVLPSDTKRASKGSGLPEIGVVAWVFGEAFHRLCTR